MTNDERKLVADFCETIANLMKAHHVALRGRETHGDERVIENAQAKVGAAAKAVCERLRGGK